MKTTMKKRLAKGILAATLAFVTVVGVPVGAAKTAKSGSTIASAAYCRHNYRHYGEWGNWYFSGSYKPISGHNYTIYQKHLYSTCVNCGAHDGGILQTKYKYEW